MAEFFFFYISLNAVKTKVLPFSPAITLPRKITAAYEAMGQADVR